MRDRVDKSAFARENVAPPPPGQALRIHREEHHDFARIEDPAVSSNATAPKEPAACELRATHQTNTSTGQASQCNSLKYGLRLHDWAVAGGPLGLNKTFFDGNIVRTAVGL